MKNVINVFSGMVVYGLLGLVSLLVAFIVMSIGGSGLNIIAGFLVFGLFISTMILSWRFVNGHMKSKVEKVFFVIFGFVVLILTIFCALLLFVSLDGLARQGVEYVFLLVPTFLATAIMALFFNNIKIKKGFFISTISLILASAIGFVGLDVYYDYIDSITLKNIEAIDTSLYLAFDENSDIARLDKEASLKFGEDDDLPVVDGAAAFFPMYSAFVEATYPSSIPNLNAYGSPYTYHNTIYAYERLVDGDCDVLFAVAPSAQQMDYATQNGVDLEFIPIGLEGFIFFVNSKNNVDSLTVEQIKGIYSGQITNWKEVGGKNRKVVAYQRNEGSGSQTALINFMGNTPLYDSPPVIVNSMVGIIDRVAYRNNKGAMGFSFRYYAESIMANSNIKLLAVNGVKPTAENIKNGSYPITQQFYIVVRKNDTTAEANRLIEWVLSDEGQYLVENSGYVPIK